MFFILLCVVKCFLPLMGLELIKESVNQIDKLANPNVDGKPQESIEEGVSVENQNDNNVANDNDAEKDNNQKQQSAEENNQNQASAEENQKQQSAENNQNQQAVEENQK
ncbi:hypothetical protein SLOPH_1193 [Spraguea lophii 42_110]|uniref:Uncharacterized protein n=1 Tax=Spraguea lophii (strain 42_110) TaxID=1358809 RepID=S7XQW8_SPRLO|nr:hypothetical protein SLOPH_1193 [Spraguea lophii 42_110]